FFLYFCKLRIYSCMNRKKQIVKLLSASALFIALMLPTVIQFVHVFGVHEHIVCTDQDLHVDQTEVKCEICAVQFVPFDSNLPQYSQILSPDFDVLQVDELSKLEIDLIIFNSNPLRGPPSSILS
ncbi:hypothetical protein, partial [Lutimonas sp.]|uniref:hypothetical protein n=1 Tax=Lutimonas sp. TaxID=1872403 RepID=UPI003D9B9F94